MNQKYQWLRAKQGKQNVIVGVIVSQKSEDGTLLFGTAFLHEDDRVARQQQRKDEITEHRKQVHALKVEDPHAVIKPRSFTPVFCKKQAIKLATENMKPKVDLKKVPQAHRKAVRGFVREQVVRYGLDQFFV